MKKEPGKLITAKLEDCPVHGTEYSDVRVEDIDIETDASGNRRITDKDGQMVGYVAAESVGYSPQYAKNWEANFGTRSTKPEDLN